MQSALTSRISSLDNSVLPRLQTNLRKILDGTCPVQRRILNAAENSRRAPQNGRQPAAAARNFQGFCCQQLFRF
jgi:hypothetical protein